MRPWGITRRTCDFTAPQAKKFTQIARTPLNLGGLNFYKGLRFTYLFCFLFFQQKKTFFSKFCKPNFANRIWRGAVIPLNLGGAEFLQKFRVWKPTEHTVQPLMMAAGSAECRRRESKERKGLGRVEETYGFPSSPLQMYRAFWGDFSC